MPDIKLKPCPFCGGKAEVFVSEGVCVMCMKCYAQTSTHSDRIYDHGIGLGAIRTVVDTWNRRADDGQD